MCSPPPPPRALTPFHMETAFEQFRNDAQHAHVSGMSCLDGAQVTVAGDMAALGSALFVIGYLTIGRLLRSWMPIWLYAALVTGTAALLLSLAAVAVSPAQPFVLGTGGLFGWLLPKYLPKVSCPFDPPFPLSITCTNTQKDPSLACPSMHEGLPWP